ncbi:hypothetical protein MMC07_003691 [Pseudocyphellaria aurata]|nr:hypothetical protein [Pseudocyphellaria aurata]
MSLSLTQAAPLKPEIKLAQALSEFEAVLPDDQKSRLRTYRGQSPPNPTDVMRLTAEIDRDTIRNRKSRQCVGTRLTNVLHAVQQFSTVVDFLVGSSHLQIASAVWGVVKISLQLVSAISSYFDQLSKLFMRIGVTCPRYQDFGILYSESKRLQSALCEYFVVIVRLCKQAVLFLKKPFWSQLSSSILKPFETEFGSFQQDLETLASSIREEVSLASNQAQQDEAKEMSRFRAFAMNFSNKSARDIGEARTWKKRKAELNFLNACSVYNHEKTWKQARKQGNTNWICHDEGYKRWIQEKTSSTLWCTGILGSGKTVLSANVVEDLQITTSNAVAYFFCRHDEPESLKTRTIIGSIARQMFDHMRSDIFDSIAEMRLDTLDTDRILDCLQELLPSSSHKYFIVLDGLDECEEKETRLLLQGLKQLLTMSKQVFQVYCSSRPNVSRWAHALLEPQWNVSMSEGSADIEDYVEDTLVKRLESRDLSVGNSTIIFTIQDALLKNAHGMFLWVAFQIDSICSQKTDETILATLKDLPKDLPETFDRILQKLQHSNVADPEYCRKIFDLMAAAQRPLTLEELCEAVSVVPGKIWWDASKLVNDMHRSLSDSCGSLVTVDEEHLTVHFTHHSVKQYLLTRPTESGTRNYFIDTKEADRYIGNVIVTYLNFENFDPQLAMAETRMVRQARIQARIDPSAILGGSVSRSNLATRLAVRLLKSRETPSLDIHGRLRTVAGIGDHKEQIKPAHAFLPYAQDYWLFHTKFFRSARESGYRLWIRLVQGKVGMIELPWESNEDVGDGYMEWILQNEHWALINRTISQIAKDALAQLNRSPLGVIPRQSATRQKLLLDFLKKPGTNVQDIDVQAALSMASTLNNKAVVLSSLRHGAIVNTVTDPALQRASVHGHEDMIRLLLDHGLDVNAEGGVCGSPLQAASQNGREEVVRILLENGADVNAEDGDSGSVLCTASRFGHEKTAKLLLEYGADIDAANGKYGTALEAASYYGHTKTAMMLLDHGADINTSKRFSSVLEAVTHRGHEGTARLLLQNGADVNAEGGDYGGPLQAASYRGRKWLVRLFLAHGADVNAESGKCGSALHMAAKGGHEETARLLIENGANINAKGGEFGSALHAASYFGHEKTARLFLAHGADINAKSGKYGSALQAASDNGREETVRLLLENGADVNAGGGEYGSALQAAACRGHEETARLLLQNGADVNAENGNYGSALQEATCRGHEEMARLLLQNGADVNAKGGGFGSALHAAAQSGHVETTRLLLDYGADVSAEGGIYGSALQAASCCGHEQTARLLLQNGADVNAIVSRSSLMSTKLLFLHGESEILRRKSRADVNAEDKDRIHALSEASSHGHEGVVRVLLGEGADVKALNGRALREASEEGHVAIMRLLLDYKADVNSVLPNDGKLLQEISASDQEAVIQLLLKKLRHSEA